MSQSKAFIQKMFRKYYEENSSLVKAPSRIGRREFGFNLFGEGMLRHKSFKNLDELLSFLRLSAPRDAYFSCAYYENPEAEMDKKTWLGADLIFDIDADHIPTPCDKVHDEWTCSKCGFMGKGVAPDTCPVCGCKSFDTSTWPCEVCLATAMQETTKLLDMLTRDFGFSDKAIHVFFSGHRGYHVHVEDESVNGLDAVARKEIVDYISAQGLAISPRGKSRGKRRLPQLDELKLYDFGWQGRIAKRLRDFILQSREEDLVNLGLKRNVAKIILQNKEAILRNSEIVRNLKAIKGVGTETLKQIMDFCIQNGMARIDTVVTADVHRLIRLTETLHGKTGLRKVEFPDSQIESFDPFKEAVAFKRETQTVFVYSAPRFRLGDEMFGPYKDQRVELPIAAAILLICKGRAEVVE